MFPEKFMHFSTLSMGCLSEHIERRRGVNVFILYAFFLMLHVYQGPLLLPLDYVMEGIMEVKYNRNNTKKP